MATTTTALATITRHAVTEPDFVIDTDALAPGSPPFPPVPGFSTLDFTLTVPSLVTVGFAAEMTSGTAGNEVELEAVIFGAVVTSARNDLTDAIAVEAGGSEVSGDFGWGDIKDDLVAGPGVWFPGDVSVELQAKQEPEEGGDDRTWDYITLFAIVTELA